jgi:hypothetical protein
VDIDGNDILLTEDEYAKYQADMQLQKKMEEDGTLHLFNLYPQAVHDQEEMQRQILGSPLNNKSAEDDSWDKVPSSRNNSPNRGGSMSTTPSPLGLKNSSSENSGTSQNRFAPLADNDDDEDEENTQGNDENPLPDFTFLKFTDQEEEDEESESNSQDFP